MYYRIKILINMNLNILHSTDTPKEHNSERTTLSIGLYCEVVKRQKKMNLLRCCPNIPNFSRDNINHNPSSSSQFNYLPDISLKRSLQSVLAAARRIPTQIKREISVPLPKLYFGGFQKLSYSELTFY